MFTMHWKAPFKRWQNGEQTLDVFKEMCKAHDLTYAFSDDHNVWKRGHEEHKLISEAAIQLGTDSKKAWNDAVLAKVRPEHANGYLW